MLILLILYFALRNEIGKT